MNPTPSKDNIIVVENDVPFGQLICCHIQLTDGDLNSLVRHDHVEKRYLAWETVRKARNPFFVNGTGFEGYFVGCSQSPEEALDRILVVNQNILEAIARAHRFEYGFKSRLMKTLTRDTHDSEAMSVWSGCLGAALARLRAQVCDNARADHFRNQTYVLLENLPKMHYERNGDCIHQHFSLRAERARGHSLIDVTLGLLDHKQQDAWLVAMHIGEFGHPLVRQYLRNYTKI